MCGIAGIAAAPGRAVDSRELGRMLAAQQHRGPDGIGACAWTPGALVVHADTAEGLPAAQVGFAHLRLSIIDTGPGGHQPMATEDGRFVLITNGEIYNYLELRAELEAEGLVFRTASDTEVLLQALAHWGVAATLPRLTGMFAFAFLDTAQRRLSLARDPFGIKPLLWALRNGDLAFASEPNALLELDGLRREVNPSALYDYLRYGVTDRGDRTLFSRIRQLPAGHYATLELDDVSEPEPVCYWRPPAGRTLDISFDEAAAELRSRFLQSVRLHLRSDVAVGAALSGGIDSSAVVAAMREIAGPELGLHTFTFVSPGDTLDEQVWADMAAAAAGATMHKTTGTGLDFEADLNSLIRSQGEPFGSVSVFAQSRVYRLFREAGIKVSLDGQGADEVLAGYTQFRGARLASLMSSGHLCAAFSFLRCLPRKDAAGAALRATRFLLPDWLQAPARHLVGEDLLPAWMNRAWFDRCGVTPAPLFRKQPPPMLRNSLLDGLRDTVLPALLRYQDRNSMTYSVESRVPFLTPDLLEFAYSLPDHYLLSDHGETKSVFRRAMRGLVPDPILARPDKIGFTVPQENSFAVMGSWLRTVLECDRGRANPALKASNVSRDLAASGLRGMVPKHAWRCANLIKWAETFDAEFCA